MLNLMSDLVIRTSGTDGETKTGSLPQVLALLVNDEVSEFPALRPHQRHPWHAFLVQLAAMALHRAGITDPPESASEWASLIRGLTPEWPDDEPWCLVAPPERPAFLQPPVPGGDLAAFKSVIETPDALDLLVTSRNHDLKSGVMHDAQPDDWLFALVSLQTMEGFLGQGNYGISRMNGGFASRPAIGVMPPGGPGAHFRRDLRMLMHGGRAEILRRVALKAEGGLGFVWLRPWDGVGQISFAELDPLYIEICRRVRLRQGPGNLDALSATSKKARIAADGLNGNTGDPWTPIERAAGKSLTVTRDGFSYKRVVELMFGNTYQAPLLQDIDRRDGDVGLAILARAACRGQGKTEGYHERTVPISKGVAKFFRTSTDPLAALAKDRVADAGMLRGKILRPALFALLQQGRDTIDYGSGATSTQADIWLSRFEHQVDARFFPDLWREAEADAGERTEVRRQWRQMLADAALAQLDDAASAAPQAAMRRYRAKVRSRGLFFALLHKHFPDLKREDIHDRTA